MNAIHQLSSSRNKKTTTIQYYYHTYLIILFQVKNTKYFLNKKSNYKNIIELADSFTILRGNRYNY